MDKREELFQKMQMVLTGEDPNECLAATIDLLTALIGFVSETQVDAGAIIAEIQGDLTHAVRVNWDITRDARARASLMAQAHAAGAQ